VCLTTCSSYPWSACYIVLAQFKCYLSGFESILLLCIVPHYDIYVLSSQVRVLLAGNTGVDTCVELRSCKVGVGKTWRVLFVISACSFSSFSLCRHHTSDRLYIVWLSTIPSSPWLLMGVLQMERI